MEECPGGPGRFQWIRWWRLPGSRVADIGQIKAGQGGCVGRSADTLAWWLGSIVCDCCRTQKKEDAGAAGRRNQPTQPIKGYSI